ncbi:response regulator [uncultured Devosia sp.]|uniref:response regulator n=1 Tax=uncultured Devosia sp. TaxID=211434 RepID=UPI002632C8C6|nr:response regulator [uncultured Devosia sp.]
MRVLLCEDDDQIAETLVIALSKSGFGVEREREGESALFRGETEDFDAVVLDLGLPQMDGLTVLKRWRRAKRLMPVLILTARGQWEERVEGIEAGADDYVVKPFHIMEIVARLRALIRRSGGLASSRETFGPYELDTGTMQVTKDGLPLDLSPQEFKLVSYLSGRGGIGRAWLATPSLQAILRHRPARPAGRLGTGLSGRRART